MHQTSISDFYGTLSFGGYKNPYVPVAYTQTTIPEFYGSRVTSHPLHSTPRSLRAQIASLTSSSVRLGWFFDFPGHMDISLESLSLSLSLGFEDDDKHAHADPYSSGSGRKRLRASPAPSADPALAEAMQDAARTGYESDLDPESSESGRDSKRARISALFDDMAEMSSLSEELSEAEPEVTITPKMLKPDTMDTYDSAALWLLRNSRVLDQTRMRS